MNIGHILVVLIMQLARVNPKRRVILVYWKKNYVSPFEVYSNLKLFCQIHPSFSYNTLNNYLSKGKLPFENDNVRIERKEIVNKSIVTAIGQQPTFTMSRVARRAHMHHINEGEEDLGYWLAKSPKERLAAVNFIVAQSLKPGERMDKTIIHRRKMKAYDAG